VSMPKKLAAEMLATTLDVDFDPDKSWDEKKEIYRILEQDCPYRQRHAIGDRRQNGGPDGRP